MCWLITKDLDKLHKCYTCKVIKFEKNLPLTLFQQFFVIL